MEEKPVSARRSSLRVGPQTRRGIVLLVICALLPAQATGARTPKQSDIKIDLGTSWHKRDEKNCRSAAALTSEAGVATVRGDTTGVLFWRIPTATGRSIVLSPTPDWIRKCRRPPLDFGPSMMEKTRERKLLIDVSGHDRLTWRWRIDRTVSPRAGVRPEALTTARIGLNVISRSGDIHEISYIWSKGSPVGSVFTHRTEYAGGMIKRDWHRIVVRSAEAEPGEWVTESRDLYADYKRLFPKEEPGYVVRLYLRADGDSEGRVTAEFSDIVFSTADR